MDLIQEFSDLEFKAVDFFFLKNLWKQNLWKERVSEIEAYSAIDINLQIDLNILNKILSCAPYHLAGFNKQGLPIACLSGHLTDSENYRIRGLWVDPIFRGLGIARKLISLQERWALSLDAKIIWTMPRATAADFYTKVGFELLACTKFYEFGPHFLASKPL